MKKVVLFYFVMLISSSIFSQDLKISFSGTGSSKIVASVMVENLTQNKSITLDGTEILHLAATITGVNNVDAESDKLVVSPNPIVDEGLVTFYAKNEGLVSVELSESSGRLVFRKNYYLYPGMNSLRISELGTGIFIVNINSKTYSYSGKMVSLKKGNVSVSFPVVESLGPNSAAGQSLKSVSTEKYLIFKKGDVLKITGKSGDYSTIVGDSPVADKTIIFNFMPCVDGDGNNYPVVQIGNQVWMGENLHTSKLNDGTEIPNITKDSEWGALTTPGYCWANNDAANKSPYGGLYNWFAVNTGKLAPKGWHVPTDKEWTDLLVFLGGDPLGFGAWVVCKLQETGNEHRELYSFNSFNATNETGFSMVPNGIRSGESGSTGWFLGFRSYANLWTSTNGGNYPESEVAYCRYVQNDIMSTGSNKKNGMAVRCIKD